MRRNVRPTENQIPKGSWDAESARSIPDEWVAGMANAIENWADPNNSDYPLWVIDGLFAMDIRLRTGPEMHRKELEK